ncbi:unnamed protein product [Camellia sinensis]
MSRNIENLVMHSVLSFIGKVNVSPNTYLLHQELLNFMLVAMSTQLLSGPSPGPKDIHPFIDMAMVQESSFVGLVVHKLLLNYIMRPHFALNITSYDMFSEGNQLGVLQRVGSAAASFVLSPFNFFISSSGEATKRPLADSSLHVLLILIYYRKCVMEETLKDKSDDSATLDFLLKENTYFSENSYCKALENVRDIEFDRVDIEGNAHYGPLVRLPFASLFNTLGIDIYLHTNCLAILANMAPHVHRLSAYASQRLVSLFDMLLRKYTKLAELKHDKMRIGNGEPRGDSLLKEMASTELHIYTDFLRIVLEILNAILTYALPRNPEVVYAIMHRQEVFQPFRNHPRFNELLENIFTVLDFFNSRMDAQRMNGEWSVEKVLEVIIINCRSWRGKGMKISFSFNPSSLNLFPVDLPVK